MTFLFMQSALHCGSTSADLLIAYLFLVRRGLC